jgi:hypothetical protein
MMGTGSLPQVLVQQPELTTHLLLVLCCKVVGATPSPPLCACIGKSWGDIYLYLYLYFSITQVLHVRGIPVCLLLH